MDLSEEMFTKSAFELYKKALNGELKLKKELSELKDGDSGFSLEAELGGFYRTTDRTGKPLAFVELKQGGRNAWLVLSKKEEEMFKKLLSGQMIRITDLSFSNGILKMSPYSTITELTKPELGLKKGITNAKGWLFSRDGKSFIRCEAGEVEVLGIGEIEGEVIISHCFYDGKTIKLMRGSRVFLKKT